MTSWPGRDVFPNGLAVPRLRIADQHLEGAAPEQLRLFLIGIEAADAGHDRAIPLGLGPHLVPALVGLEGPLRVRVVVDLLAAPLLAAPVQDDDRALQGELPRDIALERLEIVAVDVQRQMADGVVEAHQVRRRR